MIKKNIIPKAGRGTRKAPDKGEGKNRYVVRARMVAPLAGASQEEKGAFEYDDFIWMSLREEARHSSAWRDIPRRGEAGEQSLAEFIRLTEHISLTIFCFKNDEPTGILVGHISHLFDFDYKLASCTAVYVRPEDRDGKSAVLLMQAFRQWAEQNGVDEMRILVASLDNVDRTHDMLTGFDFAHIGGNYGLPLSEKSKSVLGPYLSNGKADKMAEEKENFANDEEENGYSVRSHVCVPEESASQEEKDAFARDRLISASLGEEMRQSGAWRDIPQRDGRPDAVLQLLQEKQDNGVLFMCFKNNEPVGMLMGSASHMFSLDYLLASCILFYVRPADRDGKSEDLLLQAFQQWAQIKQADELRILAASLDDVDRTHERLTSIGFAHLGGNYAFPLSEKGRGVLETHQPSNRTDRPTT